MPDEINLNALPVCAIPIPEATIRSGSMLDEFVKVMADGARMNLENDGEVAPVVSILGKDLRPGSTGYCVYVLLVSRFMGDPHGKDILAAMLPELAEQFGGFAICMVTEAWALQGESAKDRAAIDAIYRSHGSIKGHPDSVEVVNITVETRQRAMMHSFVIERDAAGTATGLGEDLHSDVGDLGSIEGRFANLLKPVPGGLN